MSRRRLSLLFIPILFAFAIAACDTDGIIGPGPEGGFSTFGLSGISVEQLGLADDTLYAATEQGIYRRSLAEDAAWQLIGLDGLHVTDFTWLAGGDILAAVLLDDVQSGDRSLYRWQNRGDWIPFQNDFGGGTGFNHVSAIASHPAGRDTVFARGAINVAKSTDAGASWRSVFQDWDAAGYQAPLIYFDPRSPSIIWAGGETSIFQPYVLESRDYGETWTMTSPDAGGDNAVYSMAVHPQTGRILIGMEGRIMASTDEGETWTTVFSPESSAYILTMDVLEVAGTRVLYAAGSEEGTTGGRIVVYRSDDFGGMWSFQQYTQGPQQTSTESLVATRSGSRNIVYLGTRHGVFRYVD